MSKIQSFHIANANKQATLKQKAKNQTRFYEDLTQRNKNSKNKISDFK